jgi:hypothetical protein
MPALGHDSNRSICRCIAASAVLARRVSFARTNDAQMMRYVQCACFLTVLVMITPSLGPGANSPRDWSWKRVASPCDSSHPSRASGPYSSEREEAAVNVDHRAGPFRARRCPFRRRRSLTHAGLRFAAAALSPATVSVSPLPPRDGCSI